MVHFNKQKSVPVIIMGYSSYFSCQISSDNNWHVLVEATFHKYSFTVSRISVLQMNLAIGCTLQLQGKRYCRYILIKQLFQESSCPPFKKPHHLIMKDFAQDPANSCNNRHQHQEFAIYGKEIILGPWQNLQQILQDHTLKVLW